MISMTQVVTSCKLCTLNWLLASFIKYFYVSVQGTFFFDLQMHMLDALLLPTNPKCLFELLGMWFPRRRATISNGRSTKRRTASSAHAATSVRTWRTSTWSRGTWIMWVEKRASGYCRRYLKRSTWLALQQMLHSFTALMAAVLSHRCCSVMGAHHGRGSQRQHGPVAARAILHPDASAAAATDSCHPGVFRRLEPEAVAHSGC